MNALWRHPVKLGDLTLKNRVVMAALTRTRCDPKNSIPTQVAAEYYSQRAGAGLMFTEATSWSPRGHGFTGAACLYNQAQANGWKKVIDAVHAKGGIIFLQIFHAGRTTHQKINGGLEIFAPSAIAVRQKIRELGNIDFPVPRAMTLEDIEETKRQFQASVLLAKQAGFDGIQLHGANGYLIDEFLRTSSNVRTDHYGGSYQNRVRFALELADITLKHFPPKRIGIKISPTTQAKDLFDKNPVQTYGYLLEQLSKRDIGFVEIRESNDNDPRLYPIKPTEQLPDVCAALKPYFKGVLIDNDSFNPETGLARIQSGVCDMISFGRHYISNPDLAERLINGWEVNTKWNPKLFYGNTNQAEGYTDYPFYNK